MDRKESDQAQNSKTNEAIALAVEIGSPKTSATTDIANPMAIKKLTKCTIHVYTWNAVICDRQPYGFDEA